MSIKATDLVIGSCISLNNKIWKVIDKKHVKPGKGGAYMQVLLKSYEGVKLEHRFSSSDTVETVMMEKRSCQFSYFEKNTIVLTDLETYETIDVSPEMISEKSMFLAKKFIEDGMDVFVELADGVVLDVILPASIKVKVDIADPVVKGQTASSSYKNATIKDDINILVPPYIASGDEIIINLYSQEGIEFVSRA